MTHKSILRGTILAAFMFGLVSCDEASKDVAKETSSPVAVAEVKTVEEIAAMGLSATKDFPGLSNLCDLDMKFRNVNIPRSQRTNSGSTSSSNRSSSSSSRGERQRAILPPMQIFDNLYFVGNSGVSAWLVGTEEDGYVLFDSLTSNEAAETYVMGGIKTLGLDPSKIKHFIISHGHGDHYGGHRYLSETLNLPVSMSQPDWDLSSTLGVHPRFGPAPETGEVIEDGQQIVLGDTVINLYVTSAHTPGTISPIITVFDNGKPHKAILWGGTGLNFGADEQRLREYSASGARLRELSKAQGVDIFLSNHPARDGSAAKMKSLIGRQAQDMHPFVMGDTALGVFDIFEYCPLAQAERIASGQYRE